MQAHLFLVGDGSQERHVVLDGLDDAEGDGPYPMAVHTLHGAGESTRRQGEKSSTRGPLALDRPGIVGAPSGAEGQVVCEDRSRAHLAEL